MNMLNYAKIACITCFAMLLYGQTPGLNIFVFAIVSGLCVFGLRNVFRRNAMFAYLLFLAGACSVFIYGNALSYITCIIAFMLFGGQLAFPGKAIAFAMMPGLANLLASFPARIAKVVEPHRHDETKGDRMMGRIIKILVISFVLFIFMMLYMNSSAGFLSFIDSIDIKAPNYQFWLLLLVGAFICQSVFQPADPSMLQAFVPEKGERISEKDKGGTKWLSWGTSLLIALNALIIIVIISDISFIVSGTVAGQTPAFFSKLVHEGVASLVFSVILAMLILFIFFEGRINFVKGNMLAKRLAYIWIACNFCLLILTFYKNGLYVSEAGLTYRRIGVWYYLAALGLGLVFMYLKIKQDLNILFVIRKTLPVYLLLLVVSSLAPWELMVTRHNLKQAKTRGERPDIEYLSTLDGNNMHLLRPYVKTVSKGNRYFDYYDKELATRQYVLNVRSKHLLSMVLAEQWAAAELEKTSR